jgi:hypothetical protein
MPFERREYIGGQVLAADDMNNIITGIVKNASEIDNINFRMP